MKKKKIMMVLLAAMVFTGCSVQETSRESELQTEPAPSVTVPWERNAVRHWYLDENGEEVGSENHVLTDVVCDVCGSEIWKYEDGAADVYDYNENMELLRLTSYDADGSMLSDITYEYEHDAAGNQTRVRQYYNSVLTEEIEYAVNADGQNLPVKQTGYYDDGTWAVNEYDVYGNVVKAVTYDADGQILTQIQTEYAVNADGWYYEAKSTIIHADGSKTVTECNTSGDTVRICQYDDSGKVLSELRHQYAYDVAGNKTHSWFYDNGQLRSESEYALNGEGWSYSFRDTEYNDDGTKTIYEYDEYGELVSQTRYDAQGNVIS